MFCKSDERHYYRAKVEFINLNGDFEKYYRFGISSTQTSEIINGAPGAARSIFGGNWRYHHPVMMVLVSYNWYMKRFAALKCTSEKLSDILTPVAIDILNKRISNSTQCTSTVYNLSL